MSDVSLMTSEAVEALRALREPFPAEQVGKLPRIVCPRCSQSSGRVCSDHKKVRCAECDNTITERHIHLDYVGHGAVTDRLLAVDPRWNWEPVAWDSDGFPAFICDKNLNPVAFWIRLTVGGVTRLGVGTCNPGQHDAEKVLIGDALRNAAMRFGVALDLWIKGHAEDDEKHTASDSRPAASRASRDPLAGAEPVASKRDRDRIVALYDALGEEDRRRVDEWVKAENLPVPAQQTVSQAKRSLEFLQALNQPAAAEGVGSAPQDPAPEPSGAYTQMKSKAEEYAAEAPEVKP